MLYVEQVMIHVFTHDRIYIRPWEVKKYFYQSGNFCKNIYWEITDYLVTVISGKEATENTSLIVKF